jgi:DNA-binding MurR/RpiR family transcriptional regulator
MQKLTKKEQKIYNAIMAAFPKTKKESAIGYAKEGGVKFQFYSN